MIFGKQDYSPTPQQRPPTNRITEEYGFSSSSLLKYIFGWLTHSGKSRVSLPPL